jgi:hypothetical protein
MKSFLTFSLCLTSTLAFASEWRVIAETRDCFEKVKIQGKESEKYVIAELPKGKVKLVSVDDHPYKSMAPAGTEYISADKSIRYLQPGYVEGNPPKLFIVKNGKTFSCSLTEK